MLLQRIFFFLVILILFSCNTNEKEIYFSNGQLKQKYSVDEKGVKQGFITEFYNDGQVNWKSCYLNGKLHGNYVEYYTKGQIKIKVSFSQGEQDGNLVEYFENGRIKMKGFYVKGKRQGEFVHYYSNGQEKLKAFLDNDTTLYYVESDSLGVVTDKKHLMKLNFLTPLTIKDSIKIKEIIPGFISSDSIPVSITLEKFGEIKGEEFLKMKFNPLDSNYYYTFPPVKKGGQYIIKTTFLLDRKFANHLDTLITIGE